MLPLGAALILAMIVAWSIAVYLLGSAMDRRLDSQLDNATSILAEGTFPFSPDLVRRLDRLIEARIALLDGYGRLGFSTADEEANLALSTLSSRIDELEGRQPAFLTLTAGGRAWRAAVRPLPEARDDRYRYVVAAASREPTRGVAREAGMLLAAAMLAAALLLAWLGNYFIRSITHPVARLAGMADRIAEGERHVTIDIAQRNEIGVLARALNEMAAKLDAFEDDLAETSRMTGLGDLASRMAHEVRNPLTAMKMQLQLLEERVDEADRARIRGVLDELRRLELIVDSSLALGGADSMNPAPVDPAELLEEVSALLGPSLGHRHITLETRLGALPVLAMDGDRMKQVLLNLINNAADALPGGGRIRLSAGIEDGDSVAIRVEDSGPGLTADAARRAADKPFGLGLGLKISREIVERHGGRLEPGRSEALGGAKFTVSLPVTIMTASSD